MLKVDDHAHMKDADNYSSGTSSGHARTNSDDLDSISIVADVSTTIVELHEIDTTHTRRLGVIDENVNKVYSYNHYAIIIPYT